MNLDIFDRSNVGAWCAVPYDSVERTPVARAEMLQRLGITKLMWDWRPEHLADFPAQLDVIADLGIELTAIWAPHALPAEGDAGFAAIQPLLQEHIDILVERELTPQLWACAEFGPPGAVEPLAPQTQAATVRRHADHLEPLATLAATHGMDVAIYNHLGWLGEPDNQLEVIAALRERGLANVGLVYQQHHGHAHLDAFEAILDRMKPSLMALGLNGMIPGEHWGGNKIYPYGHGLRDVELARIIATSGWSGPIDVLSHTMDDAEDRLRDNLEGLEWVQACLRAEEVDEPRPDGPPAPRIPEPVWPH